jgi:hypothetical protein
MNLCNICLTHTVDDQRAAIAVSTIFSEYYKNIRNANNLSKRIRDITKYPKLFIHSLKFGLSIIKIGLNSVI